MRIVIFDLGTSSLKVSIFGETGEIIDSKSFFYPTYKNNDTVEQNPYDWERAFMNSIQFVTNKFKWEDVSGISFTGQMEDFIILNDSEKLKGNVILYSDTRGDSVTSEMNDTIGKERFMEISGNYLDAMMPLTKLYKVYKKEGLNNIGKVIFGGGDYLIWLLTKKVVTNPTNASTTGFYDIKNRKWSDEIITAFHIPNKILPDIYPPDAILGETTSYTYGKFGIPAGVKIINGIGDAGASTLGSGIYDTRKAYIYLGTTGWIATLSENLPKKHVSGIFALDFMDERYLLIGAPLNVGAVYEFLKNLFGKIDEPLYENRQIPVFLPYLSGERSPFVDPSAMASWIGIKDDTKMEDFILSAMEGVAFSLYHTALSFIGDHMPKEIVLTGGITKNDTWCHLFSNVFNTESVIPKFTESPSIGTYIIAKRALTKQQLLSNTILQETEKIYMPNRDMVNFHKKRFEIYTKLYPLLKEVYNKLRS